MQINKILAQLIARTLLLEPVNSKIREHLLSRNFLKRLDNNVVFA